jgi:SAM-dependent methyltransferase
MIQSSDLICPDCRTRLTVNDNGARCPGCQREFPAVFDGVLSLLPKDQEGRKSEIMNWWSTNNMDLDWRKPQAGFEKGTWDYFRETDRRWFNWCRPFLHTTYPLMSKVLDCRALKGQRVLDLGCGVGIMFEQLSALGADVTGLDLAPNHVYLTNRRKQLFHLSGRIIHGDAERLPFEDGTFDFVYSWGVIHHSPNTRRSFEEIHRVLKPGGKFFVMVYHRGSYHYWWNKMVKWGILRGYLLRMTPAQVADRSSDGVLKGGNPLSQHFSRAELLDMTKQFANPKVTLHGHPDMIRQFPIKRLPLGKLFIPTPVAAWLTTHIGHLAIVTGTKR